MLYEIKNPGRAIRVIYDTSRKAVSINPGETKTVSLDENTAARLSKLAATDKKGETELALTRVADQPAAVVAEKVEVKDDSDANKKKAPR